MRTDLPARAAILLAALALLIVVAVAGVSVGTRAIAPAEIWRAFADYAGSDDHLIVRDVRVPRTILGILVGAALGASGTLIQTLTRNPLAEPGILGVTAGAGFAINLGGALGLAGSQSAQLMLAFAGSVLAVLLVYSVGRTSPLRLVLAGVALSSVLAGLSLGMRLMLPDVFDRFRFWSVGALAGREQMSHTIPLLAIGIALVCAMAMARPLNAMVLGDQVAHTLGGHTARTKLGVLVLVTLLAGAATAVAGPITFVGLMIPHLARRPAAGSIPWLMAYTMVLGPILLLVSDIGSRVLLPTGEVPVAVVTAFLGGPVLIWVVRRYGAASL
ncbi:iron chelate uptake ABC transporter family permease subunit [Streptosporangium sp. NPDC001681]|uniref:FecCD family ABC transporter permease n=1 Tax=Streptosporangium sp. NPDC001681 TaxID=3154395 RepID=UPI00331BFDB8